MSSKLKDSTRSTPEVSPSSGADIRILSSSLPPPIFTLEPGYPKIMPLNSEYSALSYAELLQEFPVDAFPPALQTECPLMELEHLIHSGYQNFILTRKLGGGKTNIILKFIRNLMRSTARPVLSFVHSRALGEVQKEKFLTDSQLLRDDLCQVNTYFQDQDEQNTLIRESKSDYRLIITTPFKYTGSVTHYSPMFQKNHLKLLSSLKNPEEWGEVFSSNNASWANTLMNPSVIFIDEVDSFNPAALYCLIIIVRLLLQRNPDLFVILASGTIGNPEALGRLFFGTNNPYLVLSGTGRQAAASCNVYREEKKHQLLNQAIEGIKDYYRKHIQNLDPIHLLKSYNIPKILLFLNDKLEIDIREIIGDFTAPFLTLHGSMMPDQITTILNEFRTNPFKICLVTTDILQAGFHLAEVSIGLFYGLPSHPRGFIQRKHRIIRNPDNPSHLDIILRAEEPTEDWLAQEENKELLEAYLTNPIPPVLKIPSHCFPMIKYSIILGLVFGMWEILELLPDFFSLCPTEAQLQVDLQQAYMELLADGYISPSPGRLLHPTNRTKQFIYEFQNIFNTEDCDVWLSSPNGSNKKLGHITLLKAFRHALPSQTLPFIDDNYLVKELRWKNTVTAGKQSIKHQLIVERGMQERHYFYNKVTATQTIKTILAEEEQTGLKLVLLQTTTAVVQPDKRTYLPEGTDYGISHEQEGMFIPATLEERWTTHQTKLFNRLQLEPTWFQTTKYTDDQVGSGILLCDTLNLQFTRLLYQDILYNHLILFLLESQTL